VELSVSTVRLIIVRVNQEDFWSGEPPDDDLHRIVGEDARPLPSALLGILAAVFALATVVGMVVLHPTGEERPDLSLWGVTGEVVEAEVYAVEVGPCPGFVPEDELVCRNVLFRLLEGEDVGEMTTQEFPDLPSSPEFEAGERVVLSYYPDSAERFRYTFADRDRKGLLLAIVLVFALAVVGLGRLRGLTSLLGLAASVLVLLRFVLPAILDGRNPVLVAVVGAAAVAYLALYMAHGFTWKTTVALLGSLASLALIAGLSAWVIAAARISGFATEESLYLTLVPGLVDVRGLVLAGIVLGALGALDDVTITQASVVAELRAANPAMTVRDVYRSGLRVGRDHIASMVNTLVLAYAGAAMPLLVLFVLSRQPLTAVANSEIIATEIIRTLVGSLGLIASVPVTTWLAARTRPAGRGHSPSRAV
jgi:uncharacterized membrane protein